MKPNEQELLQQLLKEIKVEWDKGFNFPCEPKTRENADCLKFDLKVKVLKHAKNEGFIQEISTIPNNTRGICEHSALLVKGGLTEKGKLFLMQKEKI